MKCHEASELLCDYIEGRLGDNQAHLLEAHLESCKGCYEEFLIWEESNRLISTLSTDKDFLPEVPMPFSVSNVVMDRIAKENRWAFSVAKTAAKIPLVYKLALGMVATVFLLLFAVQFFNSYSSPQEVAFGGEWFSVKATDTVTSVDEIAVKPSSTVSVSGVNETAVASIGDPILFSPAFDQVNKKPNYVLIYSFFGILITVLGLNWLARE